MEQISKYLKNTDVKSSVEPLDIENVLLRECDRYNSRVYQSEEYDCPNCNNRGNFMIHEPGYNSLKKCDCASIRESNLNINRSGLNKIFQQYTFDNWKSENSVQKNMKKICIDYIENYDKQKWLFIGGQVGSGKTHIATATLQELMRRSHVGTYKRWHEIVKELKTGMNTKDYQLAMHELKNADLLYIDDFLKNATDSDLNIAFEIIQARVDRQKATIITSELYLDEIKDEAISSRIHQSCKDNVIEIRRDNQYNYRSKE